MASDIVVASTDRLHALATLFGHAFVVEPMMLWSSGDGGDLADRFTRQYRWFIEQPLANGMVWETAKPGGAALWIPPTGTEEWEQSLFDDQRVADVAEDMVRYTRFWSWIAEHQPDESAWHLDTVAVDSSKRGQGLGAAAHRARPGLRADATASPPPSRPATRATCPTTSPRLPGRPGPGRAGRRPDGLVHAHEGVVLSPREPHDLSHFRPRRFLMATSSIHTTEVRKCPGSARRVPITEVHRPLRPGPALGTARWSGGAARPRR